VKAKNSTHDTVRSWILPLLQELEHTNLQANPHVVIEEKTYPISFLGAVPIHVTPGEDLDRISQRGGVRASPHGLVQEFLNRTDAHLWGLVLNGEKLRLLRDNAQVTRPAYVQFDLEEIFDQGDTAGFRLLWLLAHRTRFEGGQAACIESWNKLADAQGARANDALRDGVERAIEALGAGFVRRNKHLREQLSSGELSKDAYFQLCLKLVYQLVFTFVVEDRDLLHPEGTDPTLKARFAHYSTKRLRQIAQASEGSGQHADAWEGLKVLLRGMYAGLPFLGVPAFGGHLFEAHLLQDCALANADLYRAVRALSLIEQDRTTKAVNFAGLDTEELGSIYESLLELHFEVDATGVRLATAAGNERKTTGSYYTPTGLIELLLESALDPVIEDALKKDDPAAALKALKVIDPACGSGHFLIAAARRIGLALARAEHNVTHPSPAQLREAVREVIAHCIYGVDLNPMAVELCKVALWLESVTPGKPLTFLDHKIRHGNSLLGTTPDLMIERTKNGTPFLRVPDEAFEPIEGDDKKYASAVKKQNKQERNQPTFASATLEAAPLVEAYREIERLSDDDLKAVEAKDRAYAELQQAQAYRHAKLIADAWCAAFVWPKKPGAPLPLTTDVLNRLARDPDHASLASVRAEVEKLGRQYRFLHTHIEFPDVTDRGGFDCVLGNPPWEHTELKEKEWFATRRPEIANAATGAKRKAMIEALVKSDPALYEAFQEAKRTHDASSHFASASGRFPLTARGRVNTYAIFSEGNRNLLSPAGSMGIIVPTGIATDDTTKFYFQDLVESRSLRSLYDFENREKIFPAVDSRMKFSLLSVTGPARRNDAAQFVFFALAPEDTRDENKRFTLTPEDIALLNPNTRTCPVFRSKRDADITKAIYRRIPVLVNETTGENPWGVTFKQGLFNMTSDSGLFRSREQLESEGYALHGNRFQRSSSVFLPLYEAKLMHQFDHRFATYTPDGDTRDMTSAEKANPDALPLPRYWVSEDEVRIASKTLSLPRWMFAYRWIARSTDIRTLISSVTSPVGFGNSSPVMVWRSPSEPGGFVACWTSFVVDYTARQKLGGANMTFGTINQLPVLPPSTFIPQHLAFITPRVLELTYTAHDLAGFARDLGYDGPPFIWNDERRFWLRAELDALYFHLYGIQRDDVDYIMDTFPIVKRKDETQYGTYRTKNAILDIYGEMARVGIENYRTRLDPPPADPRVAHKVEVEA